MGRRLAILVFLCLTLVLALFFPKVWERALNREESLPPGISAPRQRLLRIYVIGDDLSASSWLKRQAARLESAHGGISVYLRTASAQELADPEKVLADLILFSPGTIKAPESLFLPLAGDFPLAEGTMRAGRWQQAQYAVPVCISGYALAYEPALTGAAPATPAPTPLLGIGALPSMTPAPEKEASFADLVASLSTVPRGKTAVSDFQSASGMPLVLFSAFSGGKSGLPAGTLPAGFGTTSSGNAYAEFLSGRCRAAMLPASYLLSLARQGKAFALLPSPLSATDMYLAAGVVREGNQDLAMLYLTLLLSDTGQADLAQSGLFPVLPSVSLYAGDPLFGQVEASLKGDLILPNAFSHDDSGLRNISWSVFTNGGAILDILESIR